jgi:lipopolysaccharide/colanic/teichoic acid biosynthesis glycosyltransferase
MYPVFKRAFDIIFSLLMLILLFPFLGLICILLLITGEHSVFYFQKRVGQHGRFFNIWKFATMLKNSAHLGTGEITLKDDFRVTPMGKLLRKTKINELPQLINVLKGDMSLVGPRPLMEVSYLLYSPEQREMIYQSRPGITGIGSLVYRDEEKIVSAADNPRAAYEKIFEHKAILELWYQKNKSFLTDCKILLLTAVIVLFPNFSGFDKWFKGLPGVVR